MCACGLPFAHVCKKTQNEQISGTPGNLENRTPAYVKHRFSRFHPTPKIRPKISPKSACSHRWDTKDLHTLPDLVPKGLEMSQKMKAISFAMAIHLQQAQRKGPGAS